MSSDRVSTQTDSVAVHTPKSVLCQHPVHCKSEEMAAQRLSSQALWCYDRFSPPVDGILSLSGGGMFCHVANASRIRHGKSQVTPWETPATFQTAPPGSVNYSERPERSILCSLAKLTLTASWDLPFPARKCQAQPTADRTKSQRQPTNQK